MKPRLARGFFVLWRWRCCCVIAVVGGVGCGVGWCGVVALPRLLVAGGVVVLVVLVVLVCGVLWL